MIKEEVLVCESSQKLRKGLVAFIDVAISQVNDNGGWSTLDDLPQIGISAVADLLPALGDIQKLKADFKANPEAVLHDLGLLVADIAHLLVK